MAVYLLSFLPSHYQFRNNTVADWDIMGRVITQTRGQAFQTLGRAFSFFLKASKPRSSAVKARSSVSKARLSVSKSWLHVLKQMLGRLFLPTDTLKVFDNLVCKKQPSYI